MFYLREYKVKYLENDLFGWLDIVLKLISDPSVCIDYLQRLMVIQNLPCLYI